MNPACSELVDLLAAREGIVCIVGAGGKKSLIYALARGHGKAKPMKAEDLAARPGSRADMPA